MSKIVFDSDRCQKVSKAIYVHIDIQIFVISIQSEQILPIMGVFLPINAILNS